MAAQSFVLACLLGDAPTEPESAAVAESNGWYTPGRGTPRGAVGNLLAHHGLMIQRQEHTPSAQLMTALDAGLPVLVVVDTGVLLAATADPAGPLEAYPGVPDDGAAHVVQVIGIDDADLAHPMVLLNDPGAPGGMGCSAPLPVFLRAWGEAGSLMITARIG